MREPNWMLVSVVVLGVVTVVLASIWESTYDARHCASDDARRSGNGSWYFSCLIAAVPVLFILTGSVTENFEFRDESVEVKESVQIVSLDGNSYISGHIGGHSFMGTGGVSGEINEDDYYTLMVSDGDGGYGKRRYKVDEVKLIFDSTEEDARVEEVDVVRDYDVTRSPFFAFDMKGECREVEHQTRIHSASTDDRKVEDMSEHILKPCPFCGSEPMLGEVRPATRKSPPLFGITCIHCGAEMTDEFVPELIQRWNTRVTATASIDKEVMAGTVQQVMERVPNALKMLEDS